MYLFQNQSWKHGSRHCLHFVSQMGYYALDHKQIFSLNIGIAVILVDISLSLLSPFSQNFWLSFCKFQFSLPIVTVDVWFPFCGMTFTFLLFSSNGVSWNLHLSTVSIVGDVIDYWFGFFFHNLSQGFCHQISVVSIGRSVLSLIISTPNVSLLFSELFNV